LKQKFEQSTTKRIRIEIEKKEKKMRVEVMITRGK